MKKRLLAVYVATTLSGIGGISSAALAAVRAGAGRAEVLAVVPVGVARRGAEWRGSAPQTKGD